MDLQGTPIPPGPRSTKVTTDPLASQKPIEEPSGPVTNDSLAAESVRRGGAFSENRGAEPMGVSGGHSTLRTTDTSAATKLPSAPVGAARETRQRQEKYPEALGGQGDFPGTHLSQSGYAGGSTAAKQQMGLHAGEYPASQKLAGQATASGSGASQYNAGQAPSYINDVTDGYQGQKPHGKNLKEGGFDSSEATNTSFTSQIGSGQDPGRAAEQKFQRTVAESGPDVGGPRQKGVDNQTMYQALERDQRV
ncbi:hypothetical protein N7462_005706 [Penicillium macrosclerotiorum]|uniref:uncharacterized protein n=1 Tax=Penicillium macrosclerotiorum TaxID=303699 RepID=UPI002549428F|nr:uncharacterized protein N7462_005706 [Penicillium macrosclerotiorum]KAJ5682541.1 hypothetical protein N7462_005706 [Penicillium macrosclerotiorum]